MNRDNNGNSIDLILVGKCPLAVMTLRKRRNNTVMNFINGFGARGYSIRGIHLPIVLLMQLSVRYKLKGSTLYSKSGENNSIFLIHSVRCTIYCV